MSKPGFTPGPWHVAEIGDDRYVATGDRTVVAAIHPDPSASAPHTANARLIAAAPALYEAAEKALNYITNTESEFGITLDSGDALRAALSLALGEKP